MDEFAQLERTGAQVREEVASLYAVPPPPPSMDDCLYYHTMLVPGHGVVEGEWDLRGREREYLGFVGLRGKRVLEVGTASGYLGFWMEQEGAEVVGLDLPADGSSDLVPYARQDYAMRQQEGRDQMRRVHNAYWLSHRAYGSSARVVYASVYSIPRAVGPFEIATVGCVLLHLRDPFLALENVAAVTTERIVVTDRGQRWPLRLPLRVSDKLGRAVFFRPTAETCQPPITWWRLTPHVLSRMLAVLGFERSTTTYHRQLLRGRPRQLFTLVAERTQPM